MAGSGRSTRLLEEVGTKPKVFYLQRAIRRGNSSSVNHFLLRADLWRPLAGASRRYLAVLAVRSRCSLGAFAWIYQLRNGIGVAGIRRPVFWGFYLVDFVFWIGISHAGTLISAILRLTDAGWRKPVTRAAEAITVFALMIGGLFPLIHLGRAWLFYWLFPYPNCGCFGRTSARLWYGI